MLAAEKFIGLLLVQAYLSVFSLGLDLGSPLEDAESLEVDGLGDLFVLEGLLKDGELSVVEADWNVSGLSILNFLDLLLSLLTSDFLVLKFANNNLDSGLGLNP
jgi:hypothetical protein